MMLPGLPEKLEQRVLLSNILDESAIPLIPAEPASLSVLTSSAVPALTQSASPTYGPFDQSPNAPLGVAQGIHPGRVAWSRDPAATPWDGTHGHWWDDTGTNQAAVDRMISRTLQGLTGATSDADAWNALFRYFNKTHGKGDLPYRRNEKIAIKINVNNAQSYADADNQLDASPHAVLALLRQLVHNAHVPQNRIIVYDAVRAIPDRIYNKIRSEFAKVWIVDSEGGPGRTRVQWVPNQITYSRPNDCGASIPSVVKRSQYLINMALLKGHHTAGVTLTAKNHYGSIDARDHDYIHAATRPLGNYNPLVDLIGHKDLGGKTLLYIIDALFGTSNLDHQPERWKQPPFNNGWTASFLMSQDPVAIDSVGYDLLTAEFGSQVDYMKNADAYLHEAASAFHSPSRTRYRPNGDGVRLRTLGVHEHWNNPLNKQYSRNLHTGNGIELFRVD